MLLVVPLLVEAGGYRERCDRILVVDCTEAVQISRVVARSGLTADAVKAIMATQASRSERCSAADDLVLNDGEPAALQPQVEALHLRYLQLACDKAHAGR